MTTKLRPTHASWPCVPHLGVGCDGYEASQLEDAFARYLPDPGNLPQRRNDLPDSNDGVAECVADAETVAATPVTGETQEFVSLPGCGGVADISGDVDGADHAPPLSNPEHDF